MSTAKTVPLSFGMQLKFKESLANSRDYEERNTYNAWRSTLEGKTVYLIGWCESAFAISYSKGGYAFEFIGGHPYYLFDPADQQARGGGNA